MILLRQTMLVFGAILVFVACTNHGEQPAKEAAPTTVAGVVIPSPMGMVNDFENIISAEREAPLKDSLTLFNNRTGHELVVVTIDTIPQGKNPVWFASEIGNQWGVGEAEKSNGLLMLISENMAQIGIAAGKDVEVLYNDSVCDFVIKKMIPYLSVGDYDGGVIKATHLLEEAAARKP